MSPTVRVDRVTVVVAVPAAVLALFVAAVGLQLVPEDPAWGPPSQEWLTSEAQGVAFLTALVALVCAAVTTAAAGRRTVSADAAFATTVAALAWASLAPALWATAPGARGAALAFTSLLPPALLHLALAARAEAGTAAVQRRARRTATSAYLVVGTSGLLTALTWDPFTDVGCLVRCESVATVLKASWSVQGPGLAMLVLMGSVAVSASAVAWVNAGTDVRSVRPTQALLAVAAMLEAVWAWWPGARVAAGPLPWQAPHLLVLRAGALALLAGCLTVVVLLRLRRRASLRRLAREITDVTPPTTVGEVVASRLGDPRARLDYYVASDDAWVDEEGRPTEPFAGEPRRWSVLLRREGDVVARVTTTDPRSRAGDLQEALGPAALLALEAERTRAEGMLRLAHLEESRRRAVRRSDLARRRAERDLHDGAQHLLLATSFALQEAMQLARSSGRRDRADRLAAVAVEVSQAAREIRDVAHGIYPVLLGDSGLVRALEGLAHGSEGSVTVDATPVHRVDPSVELTAYLVAAAAVRAAGTDPVRLAVSHDAGCLRLTVVGVRLPDDDVRPLVDRARALGGTMVGMADTWHLELPCG